MSNPTENKQPVAVDYVNAEIDRWSDKAHINCNRDTLCSTIGIIGGSVSSLLSAATLTVRASGVNLPIAAAVIIGCAGVIIGCAITVCTQMQVKHAYAERWVRIRYAIEDLRHEVRCRLLSAADYSGLSAAQGDDLLMQRFKLLHDRAWGRSPAVQMPRPQA